MNITTITGNLGTDPESHFTPEGVHIVSFPMAFKSGKDKTSWIRITTFNKLADLSEKYLHKGAKIGVSGALDQDKWTDTAGQQHTNYKVLANTIEFIKTDGRGFDKSNPAPDDDFIPEEEVQL